MSPGVVAARRLLLAFVPVVAILLAGAGSRADVVSLPLSVQFQPLATMLESAVPSVFQSAPGGDAAENGAFRVTYEVRRTPLQIQFSSGHFIGSTVPSYAAEGCVVGPRHMCPSLGSCKGTGTVDFAGDVTASDDGPLHVGFASVNAHPAACVVAGHDAAPAMASKVASRFRDQLGRGGALFEGQPFFQGSINRVWTAASTLLPASAGAGALAFRPRAVWLDSMTITDTSANASLNVVVAPELDVAPFRSGPASPVLCRTVAGSRWPFNLVVPWARNRSGAEPRRNHLD